MVIGFFKPSKPEKILVNFMRPVSNTTLFGVGEQNAVLSLLANFCYDDEIEIWIKGVRVSVFDLVYSQFVRKYPTVILPTRRVFKAARSGEESGGSSAFERALPSDFYSFEFPLFVPDLTAVTLGLEESGKSEHKMPVEVPATLVVPTPKLERKKELKIVPHVRVAPPSLPSAPTLAFSDDALAALEAIRKCPKDKRQNFMRNYIRKLKKKKLVQDNLRNVRDDSNNGIK